MGKRRNLDNLASLGDAFNTTPNDTEDTNMMEEDMPQTQEDAPVNQVPEPVAPAPVVEAPAPAATQPTTPGGVRVETMKEKITTFIRDYPVNAPMSEAQKTVMLRQVEMMVNILLSSETAQESATHLSSLRAAFHANEGGVFSSKRILGQMRDPRTGRLHVANPRTINVVALIYMTANPKTFLAQRGRVDVATSLVGCPETPAQFIMQYYS